jgi:large subunit ribosomal protein L19e
MNLNNKKELAAKVLGVGKNKIYFSPEGINEIKEAITRQDILDLNKSGIILVKEDKGRAKKEKKKRKSKGKVRRKVKQDKREYVIITRKLRTYSKFLLKTKKIHNEKYRELRKMIKAKKFKSKRHLNEILGTKE